MTPDQYEGSKKMFYDGIAKGVPENQGKDYMMRETWLADAPHTEAAQKWVLNIWECFDSDHNNQLTVCIPPLFPFNIPDKVTFCVGACATFVYSDSWTSGSCSTASASTARWSSV